MVEVDVRGYSRGIPTIRTQKAIREHPQESVTVLVDAGWAKDDIMRLGINSGYTVKVERVETGYRLELNPREQNKKG